MANKKQDAEQKIPSTFNLLFAIRDCRYFKGPSRQLLHALALHARPTTKSKGEWFSAFPSYATLAEETGLDRRTLMRVADHLEKETPVFRRNKRAYKTNYFYISYRQIKNYADAVLAKENANTGDDFDPDEVDG